MAMPLVVPPDRGALFGSGPFDFPFGLDPLGYSTPALDPLGYSTPALDPLGYSTPVVSDRGYSTPVVSDRGYQPQVVGRSSLGYAQRYPAVERRPPSLRATFTADTRTDPTRHELAPCEVARGGARLLLQLQDAGGGTVEAWGLYDLDEDCRSFCERQMRAAGLHHESAAYLLAVRKSQGQV